MLKQVNTVVRELKSTKIPTRYDDITKELRQAKQMSKSYDYFEYIQKQSEYVQNSENKTYKLGNILGNILKKTNN